MQKKGLATAAAIGTVVLALAAGVAIKKYEPFSEPSSVRAAAQPEKMLFIPQYNGRQANIIVIEPTEKTAGFVDSMKPTAKRVDWKNPESAGAFLALKISGMKKPVSSFDSLQKYLLRADYKKIISPDDFFNMGEVLCAERSVLLAACMKQLGFAPQIVLMEEKAKSGEMHMLVRVKTQNGFAYLDPTYGIACNSPGEFLRAFCKMTGQDPKNLVMYPAIAYSEGFRQYLLSDSGEQNLTAELGSKRAEIK